MDSRCSPVKSSNQGNSGNIVLSLATSIYWVHQLVLELPSVVALPTTTTPPTGNTGHWGVWFTGQPLRSELEAVLRLAAKASRRRGITMSHTPCLQRAFEIRFHSRRSKTADQSQKKKSDSFQITDELQRDGVGRWEKPGCPLLQCIFIYHRQRDGFLNCEGFITHFTPTDITT